jgi:hypothetical protein
MNEQVYEAQSEIVRLENEIDGLRSSYILLGNRYVDLKVKVRMNALTYLADNPDCKKMAMDKLEMSAAKTKEQLADYHGALEADYRKEIADKLMDSMHRSVQAAQSIMAWHKTVNPYSGGAK